MGSKLYRCVFVMLQRQVYLGLAGQGLSEVFFIYMGIVFVVTHRDHVVCPRPRQRRCHHHTFRFLSITWREALVSFKLCRTLYHSKYRPSSILVIIPQILAELWPFFDLVFVVSFYSVTFQEMHWFHSMFIDLVFVVSFYSVTFQGMHWFHSMFIGQVQYW